MDCRIRSSNTMAGSIFPMVLFGAGSLRSFTQYTAGSIRERVVLFILTSGKMRVLSGFLRMRVLFELRAVLERIREYNRTWTLSNDTLEGEGSEHENSSQGHKSPEVLVNWHPECRWICSLRSPKKCLSKKMVTLVNNN